MLFKYFSSWVSKASLIRSILHCSHPKYWSAIRMVSKMSKKYLLILFKSYTFHTFYPHGIRGYSSLVRSCISQASFLERWCLCLYTHWSVEFRHLYLLLSLALTLTLSIGCRLLEYQLVNTSLIALCFELTNIKFSKGFLLRLRVSSSTS
jgi:hypothetical protein